MADLDNSSYENKDVAKSIKNDVKDEVLVNSAESRVNVQVNLDRCPKPASDKEDLRAVWDIVHCCDILTKKLQALVLETTVITKALILLSLITA